MVYFFKNNVSLFEKKVKKKKMLKVLNSKPIKKSVLPFPGIFQLQTLII